MLNHASWVNGKKVRSESTSQSTPGSNPDDPYLEEFGKPFSKPTESELDRYYGEW
jgi:hypothetical protein